MAEFQFIPGAITIGSDGSSPSDVVGAEPWGDGSDSTYVMVSRSLPDTEFDPSPPSSSWAYTTPLTLPAGELTSLRFDWRAKVDAVTSSGDPFPLTMPMEFSVALVPADTAALPDYGAYALVFQSPTAPANGITFEGFYEATAGVEFPTGTPTSVINDSVLLCQVEYLLEGMGPGVDDSYVARLWMYELTATFGYIADAVSRASSESFTRIYPRDSSSAARVYPPPRTGRLVGGQR